MRDIVAPRGQADAGVLHCECGWEKRFTTLQAALRAHARHTTLARARARRARAHRLELHRKEDTNGQA